MFHRSGKALLEDVKVDMKNEGERLVVTLSSDDKAKIAKLEKKLKAFHTLHEEGACC